MEKIDRLGWADGFALISYGLRIGIRASEPKLLPQLVDRLPPGWKPARTAVVDRLYSIIVGAGPASVRAGPGSRNSATASDARSPRRTGLTRARGVRRVSLVYADIVKLAQSLDIDDVLESFESDLELYVAEWARRRLFVHAGVVGWRGKGIVIPGRSFSGKTRLVAELVKAGATYYSDEYAVLDSSGRVHPYPRPLALRLNESARQTKHPVESLGGYPGHKPLPVGLVVACRYKRGAEWRPRLLSAGQGALELLANAVPARRNPQASLATIQKIVSEAPVLKGTRGEAEAAAASILIRLDREQDV
jgi:hypothetical protein